MRIILFGAPGSGKGTQSEILSRSTGLPRIATGDLLRQAIRAGTPLGRAAEPCLNAGELVGDDVVIGLVRDRIASPDCRAGYILDGFPRTVAQAEALEALDPGRTEVVIGIEIGAEALVERLVRRRVCGSCQAVFNLGVRPPARPGVCDSCGAALESRSDDSPEIIRERFRVYQIRTEPLKAFYRARRTFREADATGSIEDVAAAIDRIVRDARAAEAGR